MVVIITFALKGRSSRGTMDIGNYKVKKHTKLVTLKKKPHHAELLIQNLMLSPLEPTKYRKKIKGFLVLIP